MTLYMKYMHILSVNIILLMFIFGAIGYIFNEKSKKIILTDQLFRYYHIILIIVIITGVLMILENRFWISFPTFQYKMLATLLLVSLSLFHRKFLSSQSNIRSIITILLIIALYSISLLIGSLSNV